MSLVKYHFNKKILIFFVASLALVTVTGCYYYKIQQVYKREKNTCLSVLELLNFYGFKTPKQKQALEFLMQQASLLKPTESLSDRFPHRANSNLLFADLLAFIKLTQTGFSIRTGTQERWEVDAAEWMQQNQEDLLKALDNLGMIKAVGPKFSKPDVLAPLGAITSTMILRLEYAADLYSNKKVQAKYLVALAGERKVTVNIDGSEAELSGIAKKYNISRDALTETHMMQVAYEKSSLVNQLAIEIIDTPAGELPRPTTVTSVQAFGKWLKKHPDVKSVTFVSSQPHVQYQRALIASVFQKEAPDIIFEVIGCAASPNVSVKTLVGALGAQIWAVSPDVISQVNLRPTDASLHAEFLALYASQPLIYQNIAAFFNILSLDN